MEQVGVQFIAAGGDVYISTVKNATTATNTFVDATESGGGRISGAGQVMIGALRQIGTIAVDVFAQAAKATAAFVGDSINVAGDFEAGMNRFQAVAGKSVDTAGLEKFHDLFISLGKELPVSTSEVEQAAIEMVSGGIDPAIVAAGGLRQSIQFASASGLSLADAAATSAKFLAGWTDSAATTEEKVAFLSMSTDTLTKAAAASSTTAAELRLGLFNTQGAAQALHASFEDTTASLALLAPAFESSAQAGTALNVFMTRLVPQTDVAKDKMKELGLITRDGQNIFFDAQGSFLGMGHAAEALSDMLGPLTDQQKIETLHTLFGNDAMKVANLLMQDGSAGLDTMKAKMAEANGVAETAALIQSGYNTSLENAKGSVEALQITVGEALLPVLTDLLNNTIAPGVNTLTDFAGALSGNQESFDKLSPPMQTVVTTLKTLSDDVQNIVGAFEDAGAGSSEFGESIGLLADDLGLPGDLIEDIVFAVQDLVKWFGTADDKTSDLGSGVEDLNGIWGKAQDVINDVANGYMAIIGATLPIVAKFIDDHGAEIDAFFKTTWDSIIDIVNIALDLYDAIVPPILQAIAKFITDHASEIEKIFKGAWDVVSTLITGALDTIKGVFKLALDLIHGDWEGAWNDIKGIADTVGKTIGGVVEGFLNIIAGFFDTSVADILQTWEDNWNMLVDIATKTDWGQVGQDVVDGIKQGLIDSWNSLTSWLTNKAHDLVNAALDAIGASSPAKDWMPVGQYSVQGIMQGFSDLWPSLTALVSTLGDDLIEQAAAIAENVQDSIADAFGATASIDRQMAKNLESLSKMDDGFYKTATENALRSAAEQAKAFADPAVGAKYYKMKSEQIFEFQKLQEKINNETDAATKASLQQQQILILKAQEAEMQAFEATNSRTSSTAGDLAKQIGDIISQIPVSDTGAGHDLMSLLRQLEIQLGLYTPPPGTAGYTPPATGQQFAVGGDTSYTSQSTYNMPIYTNQSPDVLQQSLAIAQAVLP